MEMHQNLKRHDALSPTKAPVSRLHRKRQERLKREAQIEAIEESKTAYTHGVDIHPGPEDYDSERPMIVETQASARSVLSAASDQSNESDASVILYGGGFRNAQKRLVSGTIPTHQELIEMSDLAQRRRWRRVKMRLRIKFYYTLGFAEREKERSLGIRGD